MVLVLVWMMLMYGVEIALCFINKDTLLKLNSKHIFQTDNALTKLKVVFISKKP